MRKAVVENNVVVGKDQDGNPILNDSVVTNVVALPDDWTGAPGEWQPPEGSVLLDAKDAGPGDIYEVLTGKFVKN